MAHGRRTDGSDEWVPSGEVDARHPSDSELRHCDQLARQVEPDRLVDRLVILGWDWLSTCHRSCDHRSSSTAPRSHPVLHPLGRTEDAVTVPLDVEIVVGNVTSRLRPHAVGRRCRETVIGEGSRSGTPCSGRRSKRIRPTETTAPPTTTTTTRPLPSPTTTAAASRPSGPLAVLAVPVRCTGCTGSAPEGIHITHGVDAWSTSVAITVPNGWMRLTPAHRAVIQHWLCACLQPECD